MDNQLRRKETRGYKRCSFVGIRAQRMPWGTEEVNHDCVSFKIRLHDMIEDLIGKGYAHFISGGSMGMDMFAAEAVLSLQNKYPWIILEMVSPFDDYSQKWDSEHRYRLNRLFDCADIVTATGHAYDRGCMYRRNRYLVDNADLLLACYDGAEGGTAMAVGYARATGIPVEIIDPGTVSEKSA